MGKLLAEFAIEVTALLVIHLAIAGVIIYQERRRTKGECVLPK